MFAQVRYELEVNPNSCFARNIVAWYNSAYAEINVFDDCRYQVESKACEPETLEQLLEILMPLAYEDFQIAIQTYLIQQFSPLGIQSGIEALNELTMIVRDGILGSSNQGGPP